MGQEHTLLMHLPPVAQTLPHVPQLRRSLVVFTQEPLQAVMPPPQLWAHIPCEQTLVPPVGAGGQALPQAPQLVKLEARSTHWPLHTAGRSPWVQVQPPLTHCVPPVQARPQAPQFMLLVLVSTQAPLQLVVPAAHARWQTAAEQTVPAGQAAPQAPQFDGFDRRSTHIPAHDTCPAAQVWLPSPPRSRGTSLAVPSGCPTPTSRNPPPSRGFTSGLRPHPAAATTTTANAAGAKSQPALRSASNNRPILILDLDQIKRGD
jgi:hypothetical protein